MNNTILTESAKELAKMMQSKEPDWRRLRYTQQILKAVQTITQIEGQLLQNQHKRGEMLFLQHELDTLINFIRSEGGAVHRYKLSGRTRPRQVIRHGLETGALHLIPDESGSESLELIKIEHKETTT